MTFGHYEVERVLGRGAMGTVYLARDRRIGRRVALKTISISPAQLDDSTSPEEFYSRLQRSRSEQGRCRWRNLDKPFKFFELAAGAMVIAATVETRNPAVHYDDDQSSIGNLEVCPYVALVASSGNSNATRRGTTGDCHDHRRRPDRRASQLDLRTITTTAG